MQHSFQRGVDPLPEWVWLLTVHVRSATLTKTVRTLDIINVN